MRVVGRLRLPRTSEGLVWLSGGALMVVGVLCLCVSGVVVHGWWQGTFQAFGVGFFVGGAVDMLAIIWVNSVISRRERWLQEDADRAEALMKTKPKTRREYWEQKEEARKILERSGYLMARSGSMKGLS